MDRRHVLLSVFQQAIAAVNGHTRVRAALSEMGFSEGPWRIIAVGKAASAMTLGAFDVLGMQVKSALVVTKTGHVDSELAAIRGVRCMEAGHPVPDARSLEAGAALLEEIAAAPKSERLLFLISGGSSSLVEALRPGLSLDTLVEFNRWALSSGLDIAAINALRRRMSSIKGGRLLARLAGRDVLALFVSDVPGNDPDVIGSGLLGMPKAEPLPESVPPWVRSLADDARELPDVSRARITRRVVASLEDAVAAAHRFATDQGLKTLSAPRRFAGDAVELANRFCHEMKLSDAQLHIWAGESTVRLPAAPGEGGRNQHMALAAARLLVGHDDLTLLAAGTDGTDGTTPDAGAVVDAGTLERGTVGGYDADDCLARADSARFLEASGDLVHTGPTGTNVGDLVLGLQGHGP